MFRPNGADPLQMRIGLSITPAIAGVIGKKKYIDDLWGHGEHREPYGIGRPRAVQVGLVSGQFRRQDFDGDRAAEAGA